MTTNQTLQAIGVVVFITLSMSAGAKLEHDKHGRIQMGVANSNCDDAKWNIQRDINCADFVCYGQGLPTPNLASLLTRLSSHQICNQPNKGAVHWCMDKDLFYEGIPSSGNHRPLWPKYGEYVYVPPQRWLHSLEHGAIVILYHPCLPQTDVALLRKTIKKAKHKGRRVKKFILTPYDLKDSPVALVAWRCVQKLQSIDTHAVLSFAEKNYDNGLEKVNKDGKYDLGFLAHSSARQSIYSRMVEDFCLK